MDNSKYVDFKEICIEMRSEETYVKDYGSLTEDEKYYLDEDIKNNYKNMKKNLKDLITALGLDINKYVKENGAILIPIEEKEFCKRAYLNRTSAAAKKLRGKKKTELSFSDIEDEILSLCAAIDKTPEIEDPEMLKGRIMCTQNYEVLKKINEIKGPLYKFILDSMSSILEGNISINGSDASYLIDIYFRSIERETDVWKKIVRKYSEIRDEEIENFIDDEIPIDNFPEMYAEKLKDQSVVLQEAISEYLHELEQSEKPKLSQDHLNECKDFFKDA